MDYYAYFLRGDAMTKGDKIFLAGGTFFLTACVIASIFALNEKRVSDIKFATVRGLAEEEVVSNVVIWKIKIDNVAENLKDVQEKRVSSMKEVLSFLKTNGIEDSSITINSAAISLPRDKNNKELDKNPEFEVSDTIVVKSEKVSEIQQCASKISDLMEKNIFVTTEITYLYTDLGNLRLKMIEDASKNALERAEKTVSVLGSRIVGLRSINHGSFSISPANSSAMDSDYLYSYGDESSAGYRKKVRLVVTATFSIEDK